MSLFEWSRLSFFRMLLSLSWFRGLLSFRPVMSRRTSSFRSQMDPFSPILKHTSLGSIQTVNSSGRAFNSAFETPTILAAAVMMGSMLWFIRIHRNPLPNNGLLGCQCVLYRSHNSSSIVDRNFSNRGSLIWLVLLSIKNRNLHAVLTSFFIFTYYEMFELFHFPFTRSSCFVLKRLKKRLKFGRSASFFQQNCLRSFIYPFNSFLSSPRSLVWRLKRRKLFFCDSSHAPRNVFHMILLCAEIISACVW